MTTKELILNAITDEAKSVKQIASEIDISRQHIKCMITRMLGSNEIESTRIFDREIGKEIGYYSVKKSDPNATVINFNTDYYRTKFEQQSQLARSERKSARNNCGISEIYNG